MTEFSLDPPQQGILTENSTSGETQPPQHRLARKLSAAGMGGKEWERSGGPMRTHTGVRTSPSTAPQKGRVA